MEIYVAKVEALKEKEIFCALQEKVTAQRRAKIEKYRGTGDKIRGLGAGLLLEYGLNRLGFSLLRGNEYEQVFLETGKNGKPYLAGREDICFNLSHSGEYAAAVFDSSAVGIDIEVIRKNTQKIAERFFCEEEQRCLAAQPKDLREQKFTELWTRKESYIKAVGGGMTIPLQSFCVLRDTMEGEFFLRTYAMPENYFLSVCAKRPVEAKPREICILSV